MKILKKYIAGLPREIDLNSFALMQIFATLLIYVFSLIINGRSVKDLTAAQFNVIYGLLVFSILTSTFSFYVLGYFQLEIWANNPLLHRRLNVLRHLEWILYLVIFILSLEKGEKRLVWMEGVRTFCDIWFVLMGVLGWLSRFQIPTNNDGRGEM